MNGLASLLAIVFAALSNLAATPAQDEYPRAHIFGRITDVNGRALEGVQVRLYSIGERWVSKKLYPDALTGLRLELSDRVPCELRVQVLVNGQPVGGAQVSAKPTTPRAGESRVGEADSSGLAVGYMQGNGPNTLVVKGSGGLLLGERSEPVDLRPGEQLRVELDFDAGRIVARVPASLLETESSTTFLFVRLAGSGNGPPSSFVQVPDWELKGSEAEADLGWIAPGRYEIELRSGPSQLTGEVEVLTGAEAVCVLAE